MEYIILVTLKTMHNIEVKWEEFSDGECFCTSTSKFFARHISLWRSLLVTIFQSFSSWHYSSVYFLVYKLHWHV